MPILFPFTAASQLTLKALKGEGTHLVKATSGESTLDTRGAGPSKTANNSNAWLQAYSDTFLWLRAIPSKKKKYYERTRYTNT